MAQAPPPDIETATEPVAEDRTTETEGGTSNRTLVDFESVAAGDTVRITVTTSPIDIGQSEFQANIVVDKFAGGFQNASFDLPPGATNITRELTIDKAGLLNSSIIATNGTIVGALEIFPSEEDIPQEPEEGEDGTAPPPGVERPILEPSPGPPGGGPELPPPEEVPEEGGQDPGQIPECQEQQTRDFTLPFGVLNNIPGVSGVDDVTLSIPTIAGIVCSIKQALPTLGQIQMVVRAEVRDALQGVPAPVVEVDEGLFGDTLDNLGEIVQNAVEENLPDIPTIEDIETAIDDRIEDFIEGVEDTLLEPIEDAQEAIEDVKEDLDSINLPDVDDPVEFFIDLVEDSVDDLPGMRFVLDAEAFIDDQIDRITGGLVEQEKVDDLQETVDRIKDEQEDN